MKITAIPQIYRNVNRWREIIAVLSKYGLADWLSHLDVSFAKGLLKNRNGDLLSQYSRETRIRLAVEELGPAFIKLGQILSTRPDLVGPELADELKQLQTNVPADPSAVARQTIEEELGHPINELFAEFHDEPLASASIGQVHVARLTSGEEVVVKVQHQETKKRVGVDLEILAGLAQLAERIPELANYRPRATLADFQRALRRELDFSREARNLQQFARDFADNPAIRIPRSYGDLSTSRVLTMERLYGDKVSECLTDDITNHDLENVARRGAEIYIEMIFIHGFYHADPHPGNLLILPNDVVGLLDFGMVGRINESLREDIDQMLMAILSHDPDQLTSIITRIGSVPHTLDEASLGADVSDFVDHYANQPIDAFDLSGALAEIIDIIRRYQIVLPSGMAMLLKVLIMLEGTGQLLNPRFSLMQIIEPYRQKIILQRLSPTHKLKKIQRMYYELEQLGELLPRQIREILQQVQRGKFDVHLDHRGLESSVNRLVLGMLSSALFLGSSLLLRGGVWQFGVWPLREVSAPGLIGCLISLLLAVRLLRAISKSGHLDRRR